MNEWNWEEYRDSISKLMAALPDGAKYGMISWEKEGFTYSIAFTQQEPSVWNISCTKFAIGKPYQPEVKITNI